MSPIRYAACCLLLLAGLSPATAQELPLIPYPVTVEPAAGRFPLTSLKGFRLGPGTESWAKALQPLSDALLRLRGSGLRPSRDAASATLQISKDPALRSAAAYRLTVTVNRIEMAAKTSEGAQHAVQTLLQLLPDAGAADGQASMPCLRIEDAPAFAYRGLMLDVARHYLPLSFLFDMVDRLAALKMNRLHLHLTDDQGWRMEIRKYPRLTSVGSKRNGTLKGRAPGQGSDETPHGGYYTQAELRKLVAYARERHIEVVPEIDMPGHMSAAIAAYPALSCFPEESTPPMAGVMAARTLQALKTPGTKVVQESWGVFTDVLCPTEYTFRFMEDVLDEVMAVFPSKYIHIGGDECPKDAWKRSAFCQSLIREKGLKDEHGLQSHVIRRLEAHVNKRGRAIIGWDEILEGGLAPNATVMSWRGIAGGIEAARQGHDVVMSPVDFTYLNLYQSEDPTDSIAWGGLTTLRKTYGFDPVPSVLDSVQARHLIGIQANLWTEYLGTAALAEYMLFPRLLAVAESGWRRDKTGFEHFVARAGVQVERMRQRGVNSSEHLYVIQLNGRYDTVSRALRVEVGGVPTGVPVSVRIGEGPARPYAGPFVLPASGRVTAFTEKGGRVTDRAQAEFRIHQAQGRSIRLQRPPDAPYDRGGAGVIVNGILGSATRFTDPEWLGWNGGDCEAVIDLGAVTSISSLAFRYFHAPDSWVWHPSSVEVAVSDDGKEYRSVHAGEVEAKPSPVVQGYGATFQKEQARYIQLAVRNKGKIPAGSPGAGSPAWMFVDEVVVE